MNPDEVGVYHCISRCVRRAFLCGYDKATGKSFEHRRVWIRNRLSLLVSIFSIEVVAYAVMWNHLHSLLRLRPDIAKSWSAEEVARRWRLLFPLERDVHGEPLEPTEEQIAVIAHDPEKVELYRKRLCSLSWFHRCFNENIARRANREDDCTGRFWEGRFKSQKVYDTGAVLACAAYIDLNPIRAGAAKSLDSSDHTSIQDRIHLRQKERPKRCQQWSMVPLVEVNDFSGGTLTSDEYLSLVDQTGRTWKENSAQISAAAIPILEKLKIPPPAWMDTTKNFTRRFKRVAGSIRSLEEAAKKSNKKWFQGKVAAVALLPWA